MGWRCYLFKIRNHAYYISVIIDLFSRMVIAHCIGKANSTQLVKSTFKKAYALRQPPEGLIFHTDRGSNYLANGMQNYLRSVKVVHSFSGVHTPYDNSVMESFFASMASTNVVRVYQTAGVHKPYILRFGISDSLLLVSMSERSCLCNTAKVVAAVRKNQEDTITIRTWEFVR